NNGVEWIDVKGTYAMYDGVDSPLTQTFGLGLFEDITHSQLDEIEAFYHKHNAPIMHEVSPLTDPAHIQILHNRGYRPIEMTTVMYLPLIKDVLSITTKSQEINTRILKVEERDLWAHTSAEGWSTEMPGLSDFMFQFGQIAVNSVDARPFLAELDGKAIATGMLYIDNDIALLAGASTIPEGRNRGAQNGLLEARLDYAAHQGCTLAMMAASPGSQSQKNAEKKGFRIAYTRTKWTKG
ncbi:MAG: GNAT family N-acetyltransferase, partial [Parachlamydiaceae bacterium]|nr:GNAT family N-acetyltransferase [Parachlamydiaceae bacterium]